MAELTLEELREAYLAGQITSPMAIDNDETYVYTEFGRVFSMHPAELLEEALTLLGIPHERV